MQTDRQDLPGARCNAYVSGGISSYPCKLPFNHPGTAEGMHVAVEVPVSQVRYDQWIVNQTAAGQEPLRTATVPRRTSSQPIGTPLATVPLPPPVLPVGALLDGAQRETDQIAKVGTAVSLAALPSSVRDAMMASSALTSLALLWQLAKAEYAQGEQAVILTEDFLDRLVTPSVRDFLNLLTMRVPDDQEQR